MKEEWYRREMSEEEILWKYTYNQWKYNGRRSHLMWRNTNNISIIMASSSTIHSLYIISEEEERKIIWEKVKENEKEKNRRNMA